MNSIIKPRLRELAARSERVVEFALVRDANGQLVESDGGSAVGTALKVGAGAAALGGAGYGGYKAYQYGKGQVVGQGYSQYRNGMNSMPASFAKQAADADFANLGKVGGAKAAFSAAGSAGLNAAKKSGFGKGVRGALLGAARWIK
jgi:hypothetical protein